MSKKQIVIVIGQSNAVSTYVTAVPAPYDSLPRRDIQQAYYLEQSAAGTTDSTTAATTEVLDRSAVQNWWSLDVSMAQRLNDVHSWVDVVVVRVATGSTDLATDWAAGGTYMDRIYSYVQDLTNVYPEWQIMGIVRMQGESDSNSVPDSAAFAANLAAHYTELRNRFSESYQNLAIVECEIKKTPNLSGGTLANINTVRAAQASVCAADPYATLVETQDLTQVAATYPVHFDEAGMITLGERAANALNSLASSKAVTPVDPTTANLVSHYKFDASILLDSGSNARDLSAFGAPQPGTGVIDGAAVYSGANYHFDTAYSNNFHHSDCTMMVWAKFDPAVIGTAISAGFCGQWTSGVNRNFIFYKQGTSDSVAFNIRDNINQYPINGDVACVADRWYHMAVVNKNGVWSLYQDAVRQSATANPPGTYNSGSVNMEVGRSTSTLFMDGSLDDFRIYDRALSLAEIRWIYEQSVPTGLLTEGGDPLRTEDGSPILAEG